MGFVLFITGPLIAFAIIGSDIHSAAKAAKVGLAQSCKAGAWGSQSGILNDLFQNYICDIDNDINPIVSKWMCSAQCPCNLHPVKKADGSTFEPKKAWSIMSNEELAKYNRSPEGTKCNGGENRQSCKMKNEPLVMTMPDVVEKMDDDKNLIWPTDTFRQCYKNWETDWIADGSVAGQAPRSPRKQGYVWLVEAQADFEVLYAKKQSF